MPARRRRPARSNDDGPPLASILDHYEVRYAMVAGWQTIGCVFHDESNPSLRVNVDEGGFQCQACGVKGGNVFTFVMEKEGVAFPDAKRLVEEWTGYTGRPVDGTDNGHRGRRGGYVPRYRRRKQTGG